MQPHAIARNVLDRPVDGGDDLLHETDEGGDGLVLVGDVALEREIGRIDLQQESVPHDRLVLDLQRLAERLEIGSERVVVLVAHRHGDNARRRRAHERLDEGAGALRRARP